METLTPRRHEACGSVSAAGRFGGGAAYAAVEGLVGGVVARAAVVKCIGGL